MIRERRWGSAVLSVFTLVAACSRSTASPPDAGVVAAGTVAAEPAPAQRRVLSVTTRSEEARAVFLEARRLVELNRESEALDGFKRAVALDPDFALALAYVGYYSSGGAGLRELDRAVALAESLPEAERHFIRLFMAYRKGDAALASKIVRELLKAAPEEWRASLHLGNQAYEQRDWPLAIAAYRRTMELSDSSPTCMGYNNLGYAQAMGAHYELALAALKRCTDLQPNEPNPHDSVGEVAMAAGQLQEAEASFLRALENDARFFYAWEGIAAVRLFRGDASGAAQALTKAREVALTAEDKAEVDVLAAWMFLAMDREPTRALQQLTVMEREAQALKEAGLFDLADASVNRAAILLEAGRTEEALAEAERAVVRAAAPGLPEQYRIALTRRARMRKLRALVALNRLPEAKAILAQLEKSGAELPPGAEVQSTTHFARGLIARAEGDLLAAKKELSQCVLFGLTERTHDITVKPEDPLCLYELSEVQRLAGEVEAAEKTRVTLARTFHRDPLAMYAWSKVAAAAQAAR